MLSTVPSRWRRPEALARKSHAMAIIASPPMSRRLPRLTGTPWRSESRRTALTAAPCLVDAAVDVSQYLHGRRRVARVDRRRALALVLLLAMAAGVAITYRWWRARALRERGSAPGSLARPGDAAKTEAPVTPSTSARESGPSHAEGVADSSEPDRVVPAPAWGAIPPEPARRRDIERPARAFGRGPSVMPPSLPAARPPLPGRPGLHLPR